MSKKHANATAQIGNKNAAKPAEEKRIMLSVRLPVDLIAQLKARGNVTQQIEAAIRRSLAE